MKVATLTNLPAGVHTDRVLPLPAALRLVVPLIKANDPARASALPLFEDWLKVRGRDLSVHETARLWENFNSEFGKDARKQMARWAANPMDRNMKNPVKLLLDRFNVWRTYTYAPWEKRLRSTFAGNLLFRAGQALFLIAFVVVCGPFIMWFGAGLHELVQLFRDHVLVQMRNLF